MSLFVDSGAVGASMGSHIPRRRLLRNSWGPPLSRITWPSVMLTISHSQYLDTLSGTTSVSDADRAIITSTENRNSKSLRDYQTKVKTVMLEVYVIASDSTINFKNLVNLYL